MFMLQDCVNEDQPNGFFNEYLKDELMKHKRVFEALGHNAKVDDCQNQLSGLGFSASRRNGEKENEGKYYHSIGKRK